MNIKNYPPPYPPSITQNIPDVDLNLLKFELLKKIDLFKSYPDVTLKLIAEKSLNIRLNKDESLFHEGEKDNIKRFYIIVQII